MGLAGRYIALKRAASDLKSREVGRILLDMATEGSALLWDHSTAVDMTSYVAGKAYIAFQHQGRMSRPVNAGLYIQDRAALALAKQFIESPAGLTAQEATNAAYTIALSVLAANDVLEIGRKASATFFEILIGHMVATAIGVNPHTKVKMPEDASTTLPTDYVFNLGAGKPKLHLPIKTSTRERIVQAWVHQLVLERIFGANAYRGMLVVIGETKRDTKTNGVIEICIPGQLKLFQSRLVKLDRVYYLDPPAAYLALSNATPTPVDVRPFGEFFAEVNALTSF